MDRFLLLTGGRRTAMPRHQTLRAAIDWSYALLGEKERALFLRLSIFSAGCTLDAIEAVCLNSQDIESVDVLDLLSQLVNKSLVIVQEGMENQQTRYNVLETMKLYGREKLEESRGRFSAEGKRLQLDHACYYERLLEQAESKFRSGEREFCIKRVIEEYENLRTALQWSQNADGLPEIGLRMVGRFYWYWLHEGLWSEGWSWLEKIVGNVYTRDDPVSQARAFHGLSILAWTRGDEQKAEDFAHQSVLLAKKNASYEIWASSLRLLAQIAVSSTEFDLALRVAMQSVEIGRQHGSIWNLASSLSTLGLVLRQRGEYVQAQKISKESIELFESTGDRWELTGPLRNLGQISLLQGDYQQAARFYRRSIVICREIHGVWLLGRSVEGLAGVLAAWGHYRRAVCLLGVAEKLREMVGAVVLSTARGDYGEMVARLHDELGAMSIEQTVVYALMEEEVTE